MRVPKIIELGLYVFAPLLFPMAADAQLGLYQLPSNNFIWRWGRASENEQRGRPDIEIKGSESFFSCDLSARFRASSNYSMTEIRELESNLRSRLDFIYASATQMNYLDQNLMLDWAILDCKKPEEQPRDDEERAQREDEARAKMMREIERRRARQQRDN